MYAGRQNLFTRDDTFFGVCEGLGEDLGIHSNWLRLVFTGLLFWNAQYAVAGYLAIGVLVLAIRLLVPNPRPVALPQETSSAACERAVEQELVEAEEPARVPLAA